MHPVTALSRKQNQMCWKQQQNAAVVQRWNLWKWGEVLGESQYVHRRADSSCSHLLFKNIQMFQLILERDTTAFYLFALETGFGKFSHSRLKLWMIFDHLLNKS